MRKISGKVDKQNTDKEFNMKSFENKNEISLLNPLSVFWFYQLFHLFFSYMCVYLYIKKIYI